MQLGFVSAILPDLSLEQVADFAASENYDCVELMCWPPGKAERRYAGVTHLNVTKFTADDAANVLYGVVDGRCLKRRPIVFTTNKPLHKWGWVLHDNELAEALLDRVLERGHHIELRGTSWRTRGKEVELEVPPDAG